MYQLSHNQYDHYVLRTFANKKILKKISDIQTQEWKGSWFKILFVIPPIVGWFHGRTAWQWGREEQREELEKGDKFSHAMTPVTKLFRPHPILKQQILSNAT